MSSLAGPALILALCVAATPAEELTRARRLVDAELRYGAAIEVLDRLLQDPDLSRKERIEAYRLLGVAYAAKGAGDSAEAAFGALLELEPGYVLDPRLSPKIRSAFDRAKSKVARPVRLLEVRALPSGHRVAFTARIEDPDRRAETILLYSRFGERAFESVEMSRAEDQAEAILILPDLEQLRVEYYLEAMSAEGDVLARAGSPEAPSSVVLDRQVDLAPPAPDQPVATPWYGKWWVWTIVAGVVGAGVAATVVAVENGGGATPPSTLDPIHLE